MDAGASFFPFDRVRAGQVAFLADARRAIEEGKHLVAHAPTGLGKTAVALSAGLEYAAREGTAVLFLTSKQSQHRIVIETVQRMAARGVDVRVVDIIGKPAMCIQPDAPRAGRAFHAYCEAKVATRTCTFYEQDTEAAASEVAAKTLHVQDLIGVCRRHGVCPSRVAFEVATGADAIVCDYNYVFSELQERVLGRIGRSLGDAILLVDEAHNLPARIRSQQCGDLSVSGLLRGAREARAVDPALGETLNAFARALQEALRSFGRQARVEPDFLARVLDFVACDRRTLRWEGVSQDCRLAGEVLARQGQSSVLVDIASFLRVWAEGREGVLRVAEGGVRSRVTYRLLDASIVSAPVFHAVRASVIMSGTLHPAGMYADLLGLENDRRMLRAYPSPFPTANRRIVVTPRLTTAFGQRGDRMYRSFAHELTLISAAVPGNVAAFFPSYGLAENVLECVRWSDVRKEVLVERQTWRKADRDASLRWLESRRSTGGLIVGVLGGGLSEGIDYRDNLLQAVCIVGLPLSPPTLETEALEADFAAKFGGGKAHDYAVVYPALNKVLQAAGRPIRGDLDRAIVILMDRRYLDDRYASRMPPDFRYRATEDSAREAMAFFSGGKGGRSPSNLLAASGQALR